MGVVTTVCGDIPVEKLGVTSMHDHLYGDLSEFAQTFVESGFLPPLPEKQTEYCLENMAFARNNNMYFDRANKMFQDYDFTKREVEIFKEHGGNTIVECSPTDIRGDVVGLQRLSEETGVNIVISTGLYQFPARPKKYQQLTETEMYDLFVSEIDTGIDGTGIRPGFVKVALNTIDPATGDLVEPEWMSLRAGARAAAAAGYAIEIHTLPPISDDLRVKIAQTAIDLGVEPRKVVMCHMDVAQVFVPLDAYCQDLTLSRDVNLELPVRIAQLGATVSMDTWASIIGRDGSPLGAMVLADDFDRLREAKYLLDQGFEDHLVFGHDSFPELEGAGVGYFGFTRILDFARPMLSYVGATDEQIEKIFVGNPAHILAH